jgi:hypothetical protein
MMLHIRNKKPSLSEIWLQFLQTLPLQRFGFQLVFLITAAFEIIISTNFYNRHIKLHERNKVLMVHDCQKKEMAPTLSIRNMAHLP